MKKIALIAALAVAGHAWAQADKPAEKPAAEAPKAEMPKQAEAPKSDAPKAQMKKGSAAKRQQDARHCLEKATNTEIIKCAEAYL